MPFAALSMFHVASILFAGATGIAVWRALPDATYQQAGLAGAAVLVLGMLFAEGAARRGERRQLLDIIDQERLERRALSRTVQDLNERLAKGGKSEDRGDLIAEMRLVRSQLARLSQPQPKPVPEQPVAATAAPNAGTAKKSVAQLPAVAGPAARQGIRLSGARLLKATTEALQENRMDLYLQPVVRLPQRRAVFHECLTRLRDSQGHIITPDQYLPIAEEAGKTSAIDNLSLFRCVQTLKARRGQDMADVTFFCNLSASTLNDSDFFDQFVEFLAANRDMAGRIVFELEAADILAAEGQRTTNLDRLAMLGFRLSADHIDSLDTDLPELARRGAAFVKIDSSALIGDPKRSATLVRESLSSAGVTLIASMVEKEEQVVELVEAEIEYAQGYLFGEPRPMREDAWKLAEAS